MERVILTPTCALMCRLSSGGFEPLLPTQRAVQVMLTAELSDSLDRELDAVATRRANGAAIESLHHRRWPRSDSQFFQPRALT